MIGLSALMTTTLKSMEDTIKHKTNKRTAKPRRHKQGVVFVGGAVLTEDYAMKIGADYYCKVARKALIRRKKCWANLFQLRLFQGSCSFSEWDKRRPDLRKLSFVSYKSDCLCRISGKILIRANTPPTKGI